MQEVQVVVFPELNQLLPWLLIIALHTHPVLLFIAGKRQLVVKLGPNETLMIIGSRINQMAVRSNRVAYYAANAAFVFQKGKQRSDYEKALPDLVKFYESIRQTSDLPFDVNRAARLELEWWIIHRERAKHKSGELDRALAELQAEIYHAPVDRLMEHGRLRAEAMTIRDTKAETGGVAEQDWARIDDLLHSSWRSLAAAVKS